jgi:hypothetical protein
VRRLVLELDEAEFKRLEQAAMTRPMPDYVRGVLRAVWSYKEQEANPQRAADSCRGARS